MLAQWLESRDVIFIMLFPLVHNPLVCIIVPYLCRWNEAFRASLVKSRVETNQQLVEAIVNARHRPKVWVSTSAIGKLT